MAPAVDESDDDPVTAEYDVYVTPALEEKLYLLQFPTRDRESEYNEAKRNSPLAMRLKPTSGFVEIDVPISTQFHYNHSKAKAWGEALQKSAAEGAHGHGLAAGFASVAGPRGPAGRSGAARGGADGPVGARGGVEKVEDENGQHTMMHQTLGGQILKQESGKPSYMIGTFRGDELHLTKIEGIVQMRPQFHHLDARAQVERNRTRRDREAEAPRPAEQPRLVQMINKSADGDNIDAGSTKELLQAAQDESWVKLQFYDEEDDHAYDTYHQKMFIQDTESAPQLEASMTNEQYLDRISASRFKTVSHRKTKPRAKKQATHAPSGSSDDSEAEVVK